MNIPATYLSVSKSKSVLPAGYRAVHNDIVDLLQAVRVQAVRNVNALMTASYWEIGRRIVQAEQRGKRKAGYGEQLLKQLAGDLSAQFVRGFGWRNLFRMRAFYLAWANILQTLSAISEISETPANPATAIFQTVSEKSLIGEALPQKAVLTHIAQRFPLPWSAYVRLLSIKTDQARRFYEAEALRSGWSVCQLDRQIGSQFYERVALSRNKAAMLSKAQIQAPEDALTPDEVIKDPYVLEFLNLKDEYSESDLEQALIHRLEDFLMELGGDFSFVGRQKRLRIDQTWFRIDLLFFHRRLRCLARNSGPKNWPRRRASWSCTKPYSQKFYD